MRYRLLGNALSTAGVLAMGGAILITFRLYPQASRVGEHAGGSTSYAGTAATITDPATFTRENNVAITGRSSVTVAEKSATHGVLTATEGVFLPDGRPAYGTTHTWSIDRRTGFGEHSLTGDPAGTTAPAGVSVLWPAGTTCQNYAIWVAPSRDQVLARCAGTESRDGLATRHFTAKVSERQISDPTELALLPRSISFPQLSSLAKGSPALLATLAGAIQGHLISDPVGLAYTYQASLDWWVDPVTGRVVDSTAHEIRTAWAKTTIGMSPLGVVLDTSLHATPASVQASVAAARKDGTTLRWVGPHGSGLLVTASYVLFGLAVPFQLLGWRQRRRDKKEKARLHATGPAITGAGVEEALPALAGS